MAVLAYTIGFNALVWMNTSTFRLSKIYVLGGPKGLSFHFEQVPFRLMLTRLRYRRDGRTDGQTAFQLYIVDIYRSLENFRLELFRCYKCLREKFSWFASTHDNILAMN